MTEEAKKRVQEYWDHEPCDTWYGRPFAEGGLEFFEHIEDNRYRGQGFIHSFAQFTRWRGKRVLEVGCGCGTDLIQFARAGAEVYGIDLSERSVELTRKRLQLYGLQAEVAQGDAEGLLFPADYFDLVYSWGVMHHSPDLTKEVAEIFRVLKPGGRLKVMVYHRRSLRSIQLYLKYGLLRARPFVSLSKLISEHQENPGTKALTVREVKQLFSAFHDVTVHLIVLPVHIEALKQIVRVPWLANLYPRFLASWLTVEGQKGLQ
ncbi:MAG: class I SAM-dependent methyltransferase [Chloroflexi bacterium]|nr:class I SAM-dependent methyltransferase [Chloroflexota bacterium]